MALCNRLGLSAAIVCLDLIASPRCNTLLPYGSYIDDSSAKKPGYVDREYLSTHRNFAGRACPATPGAGTIARHWFEKIHASGGQNSERTARAFYP